MGRIVLNPVSENLFPFKLWNSNQASLVLVEFWCLTQQSSVIYGNLEHINGQDMSFPGKECIMYKTSLFVYVTR